MKKQPNNRNFLLLMLIACIVYLMQAGMVLLRNRQHEEFYLSNRMREVTQSAVQAQNALKPIRVDVMNGTISLADGEKSALRIVRSMGNNDYLGHLFVFQEDGLVLQYPEDDSFVGSNILSVTDMNGKQYLQELLFAAKANPSGGLVKAQLYVSGSTTSIDKELFAIYIPELKWLIGTSLYDGASFLDAQQMAKTDRIESALALFFTLAFIIIITTYVLRNNRLTAESIEKTLAAEENVQSLLNSIHDGLFIHAINGVLLDVNHRAREMFGIRQEEISKLKIYDISDEQRVSQQQINQIFEEVQMKGTLVFEWHSKRYDTGELFETEVAIRKTIWHEKEAFLAQVRDVTERKRTEAAILESERRYRSLYDAVDIGIIMLDGNYIVDANAAATRLFGYSLREFFGMAPTILFPQEQRDGVDTISTFQQYVDNLQTMPDNTVSFRWRQKKSNGTLFDSEVTLHLLDLAEQSLCMMMIRDITSRIRLETERDQQVAELRSTEELMASQHNELETMYRELAIAGEKMQRQYAHLEKAQQELLNSTERYRVIAEGANDVIWDWDAKRKRLYISDRFYELMGYDRQRDVITYDIWRGLVHPDDRNLVWQVYHEHLTGERKRYSVESRLRAKDGSYRWFLSSGILTLDEQGNVLRFAGSLTDIGEKKQQDGIIGSLAYYDHLTGLPNRTRFVNELEANLTEGGEGALLSIDIDNFKILNDTFGHNYGDRIIKKISEFLADFVDQQKHLLLARFGGDEFMILAHHIADQNELVQLADNLIVLFEQPIQMEEGRIHLNCSIGIARFPLDAANKEDLLKNADTALYHAKAMGKKQYQFYSQKMGDEVARRMEIEGALREAILKGEMQLYYQPIVDAKTKEIVSFEALIRWFSDRYGVISPLKFIPLAEETGIIFPLGKWVIQEACKFSSKLKSITTKPISISINVSPIQFMQDDFMEHLTGCVKEYELDNHLLGIEITESILVQNFPVVKERLARLKEMGFRLYMDDFGTGYSSLNYLRKLPLDIVKIDKSFIDGILTDQFEMSLVSNIIQMARGLRLKVVAEGVEQAEQFTMLANAQCDMIQGYYISKPVSEEEAVAKLLDKRNFT